MSCEPNAILSLIYSSNFSKQYINYTTTLLEGKASELLTFGVLGRIFHLDEFDDGEGTGLFYLLLSLLLGILVMFLVVKFLRFK